MATNNERPESDFIFDKRMTCVVCDQPFTTKVLKSNRARRIGSDPDLRPRFEHVDTIKYGVCSCPHCGYSALHNSFSHLAGRQIENIKEKVCARYLPEDRTGWTEYTYDQALRMHQLALECAEAKMGKDGEKAYLHLMIAWLYREKEALSDGIAMEELREAEKKNSHERFEEHYEAAFEGFQQAMMNEMFPIAGLNQPTLEYILAYMGFHFGKLEMAAKMVSSVITNSSASRNVKDHALELKDEIIREIKNKKR